MNWLTRLLHLEDQPEHIRQALESAEKATEATEKAQGAAKEYWKVRKADDRLRLAKVDATLANEQRRR